ncbi:MAG TPA: Wzz/FepE/Etk N-terminal domain-containing protein [Fimbriimonadaceae bacterium]|nr:Wzz/FepE/Etk N-terminal domain-containing protein [Fimbriimonadaceae bacterium]
MMKPGPEQELPSLTSLIWKRRKIAFGVAGVIVAAGIAYTVFAPPIWEAKATIVFPVRTPSILGSSNFDQSSLAATLTGGPTPLKVFGGMLESQHALEYVAKATGLKKREVKDMRTIQDQAMESSITISARDRNPDLAKKVVQLHLDALQEINQKVSKPLDSNDADVLASRIDAQQKKLADAEQRLLQFQNHAVTAPSFVASGSGKDTTIVPAASKWAESLKQLQLDYDRANSAIQDVDSRTHAIAKNGGKWPSNIPQVQKWRDKLSDLQYDLQVQEITLAPTAPEIVKINKAIDITKDELQKELNKYAAATSAGAISPAGSDLGPKLPELMTQRVVLEAQINAVSKLAKLAPQEAMELSRLTREVSTESGILQQLQAEHELAKIQEDRDPNRWEVLDEPEVDDKPVNKSFSKNGAMSLIIGLALGAFAALVWPKRKSPKLAEAAEPQKKAA